MAAKFVTLFIVCLTACHDQSAGPATISHTIAEEQNPDVNPYRKISEIPLPSGFQRSNMPANSFAIFLQQLPLKRDKTVYLFNGKMKGNQSAQFAVLDVPVGNKDLQQCADAVMRLRAEYLFSQRRFSEIVFYDNNGKAYRLASSFKRSDFEKYLERVFGMCGSASLSKQLVKTNVSNIKAGDVFIRGGFPGHAVIVMEVIENNRGEKKFLLAQSYMPAQDIHILNNPSNDESPWYDLDESSELWTPEYSFLKEELKTW